jgi:glutamate decarboxylase
LPPALDDVAVLRVVVRNGFSRDLAKMLLDNLQTVLKRLATSTGPNRGPTEEKASFHH